MDKKPSQRPFREPSLEQIEKRILRCVRFNDTLLQEVKKVNGELQEGLGMGYAKYIGLTSPFEKAIHVLKEVRTELGSYLEKVRADLRARYKERYAPTGRNQRDRGSANPRLSEKEGKDKGIGLS